MSEITITRKFELISIFRPITVKINNLPKKKLNINSSVNFDCDTANFELTIEQDFLKDNFHFSNSDANKNPKVVVSFSMVLQLSALILLTGLICKFAFQIPNYIYFLGSVAYVSLIIALKSLKKVSIFRAELK